MYFGNLAGAVSADALQAFASKAGAVKAVTATESGRFAYVEFASEAAAAKAVETLNGSELEGRTLAVELSREPKERVPREPRAPRAPAAEREEAPEDPTRIALRNLPRETNNAVRVWRRRRGCARVGCGGRALQYSPC